MALASMYILLYIFNEHMANTLSIADARRNLPSLIREAENGNAVTLTRHGTPVAVLVGQRQYEQLSAGRRSFADAYKHFAKATRLADLNLDPDALFADSRDSAPGRDVQI